MPPDDTDGVMVGSVGSSIGSAGSVGSVGSAGSVVGSVGSSVGSLGSWVGGASGVAVPRVAVGHGAAAARSRAGDARDVGVLGARPHRRERGRAREGVADLERTGPRRAGGPVGERAHQVLQVRSRLGGVGDDDVDEVLAAVVGDREGDLLVRDRVELLAGACVVVAGVRAVDGGPLLDVDRGDVVTDPATAGGHTLHVGARRARHVVLDDGRRVRVAVTLLRDGARVADDGDLALVEIGHDDLEAGLVAADDLVLRRGHRDVAVPHAVGVEVAQQPHVEPGAVEHVAGAPLVGEDDPRQRADRGPQPPGEGAVAAALVLQHGVGPVAVLHRAADVVAHRADHDRVGVLAHLGDERELVGLARGRLALHELRRDEGVAAHVGVGVDVVGEREDDATVDHLGTGDHGLGRVVVLVEVEGQPADLGEAVRQLHPEGVTCLAVVRHRPGHPDVDRAAVRRRLLGDVDAGDGSWDVRGRSGVMGTSAATSARTAASSAAHRWVCDAVASARRECMGVSPVRRCLAPPSSCPRRDCREGDAGRRPP